MATLNSEEKLASQASPDYRQRENGSDLRVQLRHPTSTAKCYNEFRVSQAPVRRRRRRGFNSPDTAPRWEKAVSAAIGGHWKSPGRPENSTHESLLIGTARTLAPSKLARAHTRPPASWGVASRIISTAHLHRHLGRYEYYIG
jgi:hypothetical protein